MSEIVRQPTPEEIELRVKQAELAALEEELAEVELELSTLHGQLEGFNTTYLNRLGGRFIRIDQLRERLARIAQLSTDPEEPHREQRAAQAAEEATARARATSEDVGEHLHSSFEERRFEPTDELKQLYRRAARMVHPDLARDDEDRIRRERLMAEVNAAYAGGDASQIESIIARAEPLGESVGDEQIGSQLVRLIRQVAAARQRMDEARRDIVEFKSSDLWRLYERHVDAQNAGGCLLETMAHELDKEIEVLLGRLKSCHGVVSGEEQQE